MKTFNPNPFTGKKWFRGALNVQNSGLSAEKLFEAYTGFCYDFISGIDIDKSCESMLVLRGTEKSVDLSKAAPKQELACILSVDGDLSISFISKPDYNLCDGALAETVAGIESVDAVEVYNASADFENGSGEATYIWDHLLRHGHKVWGVASDGETSLCGIAKAWIMVSADELKEKSILTAIKEGSFYSTSGPTIHKFFEKDGKIAISCSPCYKIRFVQYDHRGLVAKSRDGKDSLEYAEFTYDPKSKYVRVECIQRDGKTARTNPIFMEWPYPSGDGTSGEVTVPEKERLTPKASLHIKTGNEQFLANRYPLRNGKNRYKGNLHAHTTNSDGHMSSEELCAKYAQNGYQFVSISDHHRYTNTDRYDREGFITLGGVELDLWCGNFDNDNTPSNRQYTYHVNGILCGEVDEPDALPDGYIWERTKWDESWTEKPLRAHVQEMIDFLTSHKNLVMLNHPNWSVNLEYDVYGYRDIFAMEIYNHGCEHGRANGYSTPYYEYCLRNNMPIYATATDDTHTRASALGGWVVVSAEDLTRTAVTDALRRGCFYSSNGPQIEDFYLDDDGYLHISCSAARKIVFRQADGGGKAFTSQEMPIHGACYRPRSGTMVRATVYGVDDTFAWTNPMSI